MTRAQHHEAHPAPHRDRVSAFEALFGVLAPPLAWIVQLAAGFAMASEPCFYGSERHLAGPQPSGVLVGITIVALVVALAALVLSWAGFRRTRREKDVDRHHLIEVGQGRTRFLALWGMILGAGFALVIAANLLALTGLTTCAL